MRNGRSDIAIRCAVAADIGGITAVRVGVRENHLSVAQMAARGITDAGVAASLSTDCRGWVAVEGDRIVGFSIANGQTRSVFALFVLPDHEGNGLGRALLAQAEAWLWTQGSAPLWLTTGPGTRAARFYPRAGWTVTGTEADGQLRFERAESGLT